jgi:hypothetical protein
MPVPLPAPNVPLGFPPRTAPMPSAPHITTVGGPTSYQGDQTAPYTEAGGQSAPYTEVGGQTTPLTVRPPLWRSDHLGPSVVPAALPGVGPPPRAYPTSPITYTHHP